MISITSYAKGKKSSQSSGNGGGGGFANAQIYNNGFNPFYLWGQYIDGRDSINGDLISNGTINGNKIVAPQGNIDLIYALSEYVNYISGHTAIFDNLSGDTAHFNQDVFVGGDMDIVGDTNITGDTTIYGDLAVSGDTHLKDVWTQNINNSDTIKTKNLEVTGLAHFFQLVIDRIKAAGGAILLTPADGFETALVEEDASGYTLYFHAKDGEKQISNMWEVNDQAICQTFNASTGTSYNVSNTYYWALVTEVSEQAVEKTVSGNTEEYHYIKLSKSVYDGELNPKIGDEIAMLGSRNNEDPQRQSAIYMAAYTSLDQGLTAPCFAEYKGINDFSLSSHRHSYIDATGASFTGDFRIDNNTTIQDYVNSATTEIRNEFRFDTEGLYSRVSKMTNPNILPANGWTDQNDKALLQEDDEEYIFEEPQQQSMAKGGFSEDVVSEDLIGMPPIIYLNADTYTFSIYSQVKFEDIQYGYTKDNLNMTLPVQTAFNSGDTWHSQARAITTFVAPIDGYYHLGAKMMGSDYTGDYEWQDPDGESGYTPSESAITTTIQISMNQGTTILINSTGNKATATITPSDFAGNVVWASSNPNAATIDQQGNITIVGTGTTTISASIPEQYHNGKHYLGSTDSLSLAITDQIQTEVTLTAPSVMEYGSSENYAMAAVIPSSYNGQVQYSTSNSNIATIDNDGNITLINAGQFTIYAVAPQTIQNGVTYLTSSASTLCRCTRESQSVITFDTAPGNYIVESGEPYKEVWFDISPRPASSAITVTGEHVFYNGFNEVRDRYSVWAYVSANTINVSVAEYESGGVTYHESSASLNASIFQRQYAVSISATAPSEVLAQGDTYNLSASTVPSGAHLSYTSNDTSIATVNSSGTITAVSTGSTYVTIHADEVYDRTNYYYYPSADSGQYNVVVNNTQNITITNLTPSTFTEYGECFNLSASTTPSGATLTYSSSDPSVIDVDENGILVSLDSGSATITITAHGFTDTTNQIKYLDTTKTVNVQATVVEIPQNVIPNNEIWYTTASGEILDFKPTAFGENLTVVSNTYSNDKGVLVLSDIAKKVEGRVTTDASEVSGLTSIHLPASVAFMKGSAFGFTNHIGSNSRKNENVKDIYFYSNHVPRGFNKDDEMLLYLEMSTWNYLNIDDLRPYYGTYPLPTVVNKWTTYPNGYNHPPCYHIELHPWCANYHVLPKAVNDFGENKYFNYFIYSNWANNQASYLCQDLSEYNISAGTLTMNRYNTNFPENIISIYSSAYTASHREAHTALYFQSYTATTANLNTSVQWDDNAKNFVYYCNEDNQLIEDTITINFTNIIDARRIKFLGSGTITIPVIPNTSAQTISYTALPQSGLTEGETHNLNASAQGTLTYVSSNPNVATVNRRGVVTAIATGSTIITINASAYDVKEYTNYTHYPSATTNVSLTVRESQPFNPLTDSKYFVIQARSATTLTIESVSNPTGTTAYRMNGSGEWTTANINANTDISLNQGDYLEFKGNINHASNKYYRFKTSVAKSIDCGGWLAALEKNAEIDSSNNTVTHAFCCLFSGCTGLVNAQDLKLPSNTTTDMCRTFFRSCTNLVSIPQLPVPANGTIAVRAYQYMFANCNSLTTPPVLSASTVSENSYAYMFYQCKFVTPPELPATNLAKGCYGYMFDGCRNLESAPDLPATTLAESCYQYMFRSCTKLENAPIISATNLAKGCCTFMFNKCSKLVTAPQLPVTTLADSCYEHMFDGCTSLVNPPTLPATTLTNYCYSNMFWGCSSLVNPPSLPATTLTSGCYQGMFNGCTKLTTAPDLPATTLVNSCYFYMFTNCTALTSLRVGFSTISGTNPLNNWLKNINTTGVCYCPSNAEYSASDLGLPSNWTLSKTL